MVNITHKNTSLRKAIAHATVEVSNAQTIDAIVNQKVPKGNVFEFSRAAGLLAVKKTSDVIPDCHPLPIEFTSISHKIDGLKIIIEVEVHTIYRTGVEVEAMHGASITALTMYDMLKPIDKNVSISNIRLQSKVGGKSDQKIDAVNLSSAVVVCSDSISNGKAVDTSGKLAIEELESFGFKSTLYTVVPDDILIIQATAKELISANTDLILFIGGTGLSPRDQTPEAIQPLIERSIAGIMDTFRQYGQERMPYAMLSRGVAGFTNKSLLLTLPGSERAVFEAMRSLFPQVLHVFKLQGDYRH